MTNEEFQKIVLQELKSLRTDVNEIKAEQKSMSVRQEEMKAEQKSMSVRQEEMKAEQKSMSVRQDEMKAEQKSMSVRQDEIYQVARAIEHNNQVGRSELDSQNIRLAKVEGKFKKAGKIFTEDVEVDKASNL